MLISLLLSAYVKATVWPIPNTATDTLEHFFELHYGTIWQPGDTIMLSNAGEYIINGTIDIYQEVTVTGDPNLPLSPVLRLMDNGFRPQEDTISVTIKNLRFDGYNYNELDPKYAGFVLRFKIGSTYWKNIIIEDIEAWNMQGILDLDENKHTIYDTVMLNNIAAHDFKGTQFLLDPNINYAKYLAITNSTFYNIPGGILANPDWNGNGTLDIDKNWIIDHNTFYNVVGDGNRALVQINDPDDGTVDFTFSNNIVSKLYNKSDARPFRINALAGDFTFAYSTIHDFYSTYQGSIHNLDYLVQNLSNVDTINIYSDDPGFADADSNDFSISEGNPLLTAGSDGGAIGDPRWLPYTSRKVVSIGAVLKRVIPNYDVQLSAKVDLPTGIDKSVTWEVENGYSGTSGAATIDVNGLLSPTAVGNVKVTAISNYDNELFDTLIVTIVEQIYVSSISLSAIDAQGNPTTEITNPGGFLTITAVIEPGNADDKSLNWQISDDNIVNLIEKTPTTAEVVAKASGTIDVTATANDGSETFGSLTITVSLPSAVENITYSKVQLLPNPASDFIRINSDQVVDVVITNITGIVIMSAQVQPNSTMNISELKAGIYIVKIVTGDVSETIQLIVE